MDSCNYILKITDAILLFKNFIKVILKCDIIVQKQKEDNWLGLPTAS